MRYKVIRKKLPLGLWNQELMFKNEREAHIFTSKKSAQYWADAIGGTIEKVE